MEKSSFLRIVKKLIILWKSHKCIKVQIYKDLSYSNKKYRNRITNTRLITLFMKSVAAILNGPYKNVWVFYPYSRLDPRIEIHVWVSSINPPSVSKSAQFFWIPHVLYHFVMPISFLVLCENFCAAVFLFSSKIYTFTITWSFW
jgi:hypothetical protein